MGRPKKAAKKKHGEHEHPSSSVKANQEDSDAFKNVFIKCIVDFYEAETTMSLHSKYVRYNEECPEKFKEDMWKRFMDVINVPKWHEEMDKSGFNQFMKNRVHDALWNAKDILTKYAKEHRADDEAFGQVILKAELFVGRCAPFAKNKNRRGSCGWWKTKDGLAELDRGRQYLIALPDTARVLIQNDKVMRGGYATIRKVRIEGCPDIPSHWEFAAKQSNEHRTRPILAKLEHQNESMAVRIPHAGVIRFAAVHATKTEGYSYWWNGGTLRHMLALDDRFPDNIAVRLMYAPHSNDEVEEAYRLKRFRAKRTELAWALLHIMRAVHDAGHLHNDLSPDNIMFHFPADESRVYIGVCDWGMTTLATEAPKSLYVFTSARERTEALKQRWWVSPAIAYVHEANKDVGAVPNVSRASEEYAVCKLAKRMNKENMSVDYHRFNMETKSMSKFGHNELGIAFEEYLERPCREGPLNAGGVAHIIGRFCNTFNWPVPDEHFRRSYE